MPTPIAVSVTLLVSVAGVRFAIECWANMMRSAACFLHRPGVAAPRVTPTRGSTSARHVLLHAQGFKEVDVPAAPRPVASMAGSLGFAGAGLLVAAAHGCRRKGSGLKPRRIAVSRAAAPAGSEDAPKSSDAVSKVDSAAPAAPEAAAAPAEDAEAQKVSPADSRAALESSTEPEGGYQALSEDQRSAVSGFFFPDSEDLDMDKSMPLEDHIKELRDGVIRTGIATVVCVGVCLTFYKELTTWLESPAQAGGTMVKFVQLAPGEFFFVSVKVAIAVGLLLAFPYALFEAALYFTPALTKSERGVVGPTVLASSALFYTGCAFAFSVLSPAALGFFLSYSEDVIESQFSIDQYFEFILSMGFATGIAFQVPVLQVVLGLFNVLKSEQLFSVWRYVVVGSAVVGAILTPSTDPITQLLLSGALCGLYFAGAGTLLALGR